MILRQFLHTDPVAISYLFGCGGHAACAVVDPLGDIEPYLRVADETGMRIRFVVDTHVHADHRSAGRALARAARAEYVLHAGAEVAFPFHAAKDGDRLPLGNVVVDVLHTPGHTPEHVCLLVTDRTRADEPWFVLTGHTLMVGDVGRTELAEDAASGARTLFASLQRLKALPDHIEVLPGAYSGSVCGRRLSRPLPSASSAAITPLSRSRSRPSSSSSCCRTSLPRRSVRQRYGPGTPDCAPLLRLNETPWLMPPTQRRMRVLA